MCGRYNIAADAQALIDAFDITMNELGNGKFQQGRYNIPPTSDVPIVRLASGQRTLSSAYWGLLPHWAKDKKFAFKTYNARSETITEKPSFRSYIKKSRCIVPATGWFEWKKEGDVKQPYHFYTGEIIPFAGIWTYNPNLEVLSCSIITTAANPLAAEVHNRMPVILGRGRYEEWMAVDSNLDDVLKLLQPYSGDDLRYGKVSTKTNSTRYHEPDCIEEVE